MTDYDLVIRGGVVVDGTGAPRRRADVWIDRGRIVQIGGRPRGTALRTLDADGLIVAPGFVDLHTHYDAQIRWDPYCTSSGWHGVTTVAMGNCGLGFTPCKPEDRDGLMRSMVRIEAIPYETIRAGMPWNWVTIQEYMADLKALAKGVNVQQHLPLNAVMVYVMGPDAAKRRRPTADELAQMKQIIDEAMDAGFCGFSLQRLGENSPQTDFDGAPMPTDLIHPDDLAELCHVLRDRGEGWIEFLQVTGDKDDDDRMSLMVARESRRPVHFNVLPSLHDASVHESRHRFFEDAVAEGLELYGQCQTQRQGMAFSLRDWNLYDTSPAWKNVTTGTVEERIAKMRDAANQQQIARESDDPSIMDRTLLAGAGGAFRKLMIHRVGDSPHLKQYLGMSVGMIAEQQGKHPTTVMLELSAESGLAVEFMSPERPATNENYASAILGSNYMYPGVSDGGAHAKFFSGGSFTTDFLIWAVRDERRVTLEEAHYRLSALPAHSAGMRDRGILREGSPADVIVYSLDGLAIDPPYLGEAAHDLPGGEWRRIQRAKGFRWTIVNGEITFEDGEPTGATPGKVLTSS